MKKIAINTNPNANQTTNRSAFSMMELIFVIVIIGIMAGVSIWYLPRTELKQAGETMINNLKYTKTLAQLDDRQFLMRDEQFFNTVAGNLTQAQKEVAMQNQVKDWKKGMWQFQFHTTRAGTNAQNSYTIYAEQATPTSTNFDGQPSNLDLIAKDPMTKECISGYSDTNLRGCNERYAREARFYDTFQTELDSIKSDDCAGWNKNSTFAIFFDAKGMPYCRLGNTNNKQPTALKKPITIKLKRKNETAYICITKGGIIEGGVIVGKDGKPQKDKEGRMRGIPVGNDGKCQDI